MCHYYHVITVYINGEICTLFRLTVNGGQVERRLPGLVAAVHAAAATDIVAEEDPEAAVGVGRRGGDVHQRLPLRVGLKWNLLHQRPELIVKYKTCRVQRLSNFKFSIRVTFTARRC